MLPLIVLPVTVSLPSRPKMPPPSRWPTRLPLMLLSITDKDAAVAVDAAAFDRGVAADRAARDRRVGEEKEQSAPDIIRCRHTGHMIVTDGTVGNLHIHIAFGRRDAPSRFQGTVAADRAPFDDESAEPLANAAAFGVYRRHCR